MNDGPKYNAFDPERTKVTEFTPKGNKRARSGNRIQDPDIPGFDLDVDDLVNEDFSTDSATGVDSSLDSYADLLRHVSDEPLGDFEDEPLTMPPFEFDDVGVKLPPPEVFNAYPPEVQRKIMEWTDRDLKARRDDESRRQDAILRANIARDRTKRSIPVAIVILSIVCAAITGLYTRNAIFVIAFLVVALAVIIVLFVGKRGQAGHSDARRPHSGS